MIDCDDPLTETLKALSVLADRVQDRDDAILLIAAAYAIADATIDDPDPDLALSCCG